MVENSNLGQKLVSLAYVIVNADGEVVNLSSKYATLRTSYFKKQDGQVDNP